MADSRFLPRPCAWREDRVLCDKGQGQIERETSFAVPTVLLGRVLCCVRPPVWPLSSKWGPRAATGPVLREEHPSWVRLTWGRCTVQVPWGSPAGVCRDQGWVKPGRHGDLCLNLSAGRQIHLVGHWKICQHLLLDPGGPRKHRNTCSEWLSLWTIQSLDYPLFSPRSVQPSEVLSAPGSSRTCRKDRGMCKIRKIDVPLSGSELLCCDGSKSKSILRGCVGISHVFSPRPGKSTKNKKDPGPTPAPSFTISMISGKLITFLHLGFLFIQYESSYFVWQHGC